jgi:hypothetical protein
MDESLVSPIHPNVGDLALNFENYKFPTLMRCSSTSDNDIQLNMQYISRRHAVITSDHGQTRVIDWESKNGVFINNVEVTAIGQVISYRIEYS